MIGEGAGEIVGGEDEGVEGREGKGVAWDVRTAEEGESGCWWVDLMRWAGRKWLNVWLSCWMGRRGRMWWLGRERRERCRRWLREDG